jgi:hypothetical protein
MSTWGRYDLIDVIAEGGGARVHRARHRELGSTHAVKVPHWTSAQATDDLRREGRAQAAVRHPGVVPVQGLEEHDGVPALVLELVHGPDLARWLRDHRPQPAEVESLFRQLAVAVGAVHDAGWVHGDLKPGNVLIETVDDVLVARIIDFGLARRSGEARPAGDGTPEYMAPELHVGTDAHPRHDVFALGCMLYELACGRRPFEGHASAIVEAAARGDYPAPTQLASLDPAFAECVRWMLEPEPSRRAPSIRAVLQRLDGASLTPEATGRVGERVATLQGESPKPVSSAPKSMPPAQGWALVSVGGAVGLVLGVLLSQLAVPPPTTDAPDVTEVATPAADAPAPLPAVPPPPAPVLPAAPPPAPAPAPTRALGVVVVGGDARHVELRSRKGRHAPGEVPAGRYEVWATFDGRPVHAGDVDVAPGATSKLVCQGFAMRCQLTN